MSTALTRMLQWRLLLLWLLALLLPSLAVYLPLSALLGRLVEWSPRADEIARRFDMLAFEDIGYASFRTVAPVGGALLLASIMTLALSPLLAGMMVTAARHTDRPLRFVALLTGALDWYGRMFRLWLVSLVPLAAVAALAAGAFALARKIGERALLESQADRARLAAALVAAVVFVLVHATIEAGRAQLASDEHLRSGWRAWLLGVRHTVRRPLAVLGRYLGTTLLAWLVAAAFLATRIRIAGSSLPLLACAFLVAQLGVAALGWGRAARLAALIAIARRPGYLRATPPGGR
jgi:hypothetical protein